MRILLLGSGGREHALAWKMSQSPECEKLFIAPGNAIPKDETHLHYGKGQVSAELSLPPGKHTLRLQFADGAHVALEGKQYEAEVTVEVK